MNPPGTLGALLAQQAERGAGARALVTPEAVLAWPDLQAQAHAVAKALLAHGVKRGDHVALLAGNGVTWVATFYGAALIGAVTVPVSTRSKPAEIAFALRQSAACLLVVADGFLGIPFCDYLRQAEPALDTRLPGGALWALRHVVVVGDGVPPAAARGWPSFLAAGDALDDGVLHAAQAAVQAQDLLLVQFTSGTTAHPKGALLTHDGMLRNASGAAARMGLEARDVYFNTRPFFHVAGSTLSLLAALCTGACLVTLPTFDAGAALQAMERERCTFVSGNDTLFQLMLSHPGFRRDRLHLRGGWAAAGPDTMRRIVDEMGIDRICWAYGLSEASPNVAISDWRDDRALRITGRAMPHPEARVRIADPVTGETCGAHVAGEIQVQGRCVMRGYQNLDDETARAFTADGWLRTGDLGELGDDGRLRLVGRLKEVFRVGGENVAPAEVEQALLAHPAVAVAQVVGVPDARLGEVPAAFVTLRPGCTLEPAELIAWVRPRLANFRVPRHAAVVPDFECIGMTASGKVQKTRLREHAMQLFGIATGAAR